MHTGADFQQNLGKNLSRSHVVYFSHYWVLQISNKKLSIIINNNVKVLKSACQLGQHSSNVKKFQCFSIS